LWVNRVDFTMFDTFPFSAEMAPLLPRPQLQPKCGHHLLTQTKSLPPIRAAISRNASCAWPTCRLTRSTGLPATNTRCAARSAKSCSPWTVSGGANRKNDGLTLSVAVTVSCPTAGTATKQIVWSGHCTSDWARFAEQPPTVRSVVALTENREWFDAALEARFGPLTMAASSRFCPRSLPNSRHDLRSVRGQNRT